MNEVASCAFLSLTCFPFRLNLPASNYRPISLLCLVNKVLERCVGKKLYYHIKNVITPLQHGFMQNRSCVSQLLSVLHSIGKNLDNNIQTVILYLDFAKAFDSVDHAILLERLERYGVAWHLHDWFHKNYLQDRQQRLVVERFTSSWAPVTSAMPQGNLLGPIRFIIFIIDLLSALPDGTLTALYADDTKLYRSILSYLDADKLQQALTNLDSWILHNNINFNASNCKVLTVLRKKNPVRYDYHFGQVDLPRGERGEIFLCHDNKQINVGNASSHGYC